MQDVQNNHTVYIKQAFSYAKKAQTINILPNPRVGAVVVKENTVLSWGYHKNYKGLHAEADALRKLPVHKTVNASLYCTLEPCCTTWKGKHNQPCTEKILKHKISHVYIAAVDPNERIAGKGIEMLRKHGVHVEIISGFTREAHILNEAFYALQKNARHTRNAITYARPFVHVKIAQSMDAQIAAADGSSTWITNTKARKHVHAMRAQSHVICTGVNTILCDDPLYSVRYAQGANPALAILDSFLKTPPEAKIFTVARRDPKVILYTTEKGYAQEKKRRALEMRGASVVKIPTEKNTTVPSLKKVLKHCVQMGMYTLMVEAGATLTNAFLSENLADKISCFVAPLLIGTKKGRYSIGIGAHTILKAKRLHYSTAHILKKDETLHKPYEQDNCLLLGYLHDIFKE